MTDEELKSIEQTTALLVENGFVIKDTASFIREIGNGNLEEVISKLGRLQVSINEGVNAEVFGKDLAVSLDGIEEVVNKDTYFKTSSEAASFENLLNDLREKSSRLFRNTLKAEEILKGREENLKDISKINNLEKAIGIYTKDVYLNTNNEKYVLKLIALNNEINKVYLE